MILQAKTTTTSDESDYDEALRFNCWRPKRAFVHDSFWHPPPTTTTRTPTDTTKQDDRKSPLSRDETSLLLSSVSMKKKKKKMALQFHHNSKDPDTADDQTTTNDSVSARHTRQQQQQRPLEKSDPSNGFLSMSLSSHGGDESSTTATNRGSLAMPTSSQSPCRQKGPQEEQQESERPPKKPTRLQHDFYKCLLDLVVLTSQCRSNGASHPLYWDAPKVLDSNCDDNKKNSCSSGNQTKKVHSTRTMMAFPNSRGERQGCGLPRVTMTKVGP